MYEIIKSVINAKHYELSDMIKKINVVWIQGNISESEKDELVSLAQELAKPENSFAPLQDQMDRAFGLIRDLTDRVEALEGSGQATEEYPEYVQPTGYHDAYKRGSKITYDGKRYICIAPEGVAVVWPPDVMPDYWQLADDAG